MLYVGVFYNFSNTDVSIFKNHTNSIKKLSNLSE